MAWECLGGRLPLFPHRQAAELLKTGRLADPGALVEQVRQIHDTARCLEGENITLRAEALRLRHENEFMLRLINERLLP
ncbi:MAG: hypothetical protein EPN21_07970 [Methylococcaceae bacterium]|nr:MAG: hypothetical protein EPN21_07970 [Methylococcaceae bacterium]